MWNPGQYLKFDNERTQPCRDLVGRIMLDDVRRVMDLGCGPGNSTKVLRDRWPDADITGLDGSADMIAVARQSETGCSWVLRDIVDWAEHESERFDLVFSNAALQWVPDHATVFPRLLERASGALAVQMPANFDAPPHQLMREMANSSEWCRWFPRLRDWHTHDVDFYYDTLAPLSAHLDLWTTEYLHVMAGAEGIVEWYKGSGLRPYLEALSTASDRDRFLAEYLSGIRTLYPPQSDGRVLFPFRRLFLVAYSL